MVAATHTDTADLGLIVSPTAHRSSRKLTKKDCGDTCVADCGRKSDCNPGYGSQWSVRDKCPLNVCCSKAGYCGTTKDFCGDKKVARKTCSKSSGNSRIIGYYEGWARNRPCNVFWPEQIPVGLYTHINFAFATIDPQTFKVGFSSENDVNLIQRLMLLKDKDPDLKIFIAIGGWTFNDPGPTARVFSDLAASTPRQKAFTESLLSFMSTYGFDGIDLDWEYPVADDRSGRGVDFENFPKFMSRLKDSLKSANKVISITIPASYWYLQHFDLKALAKSVDWFNVMSYDLHGTWDKGNKWTGNFLNAHTNLTEISDALDLIWRNDIDPGKVVLGLGFYGRAFTATSPSCLRPQCTFESGGESGECSREIGILLNSEIDDLVKEHNVTPTLYKDEAVKVAAWGNQWVSYDDEETFKLKSEFAQSLCMGGLMVWAISHDTQDAKYNKALAKVANRKVLALPMTDGSDEPYQFVNFPIDQCKWTNCAEGKYCPSGWVAMRRKDGGARKGELMVDHSACAGIGVHTFCCPTSSELPTCGWYTHHNGNCDSKCPQGTIEIGSNSMHCKKNYQAACCTWDTDSMRLYQKCEWGQYPVCNSQEGCPGTDRSKYALLALSSGGSGGASCNVWKANPLEVQQRKYCCDFSNPETTFTDCEWYDNIGVGPASAPANFCRSGCPNDRVRVAMDQWSQGCFPGGGGAKAMCCVPKFSEVVEVENPKLDAWRSDMREFMENPVCANPGPITNSLSLQKRQKQNPIGERPAVTGVESLLLALVVKVGTSAMLEAMGSIWDTAVREKFPNLRIAKLRDFLTRQSNYLIEGPLQMIHRVVCNPHYWNHRVGGGRTTDCSKGICTTESCDNLVRRAEHRTFLEKRARQARDYTATMVSPDGTTLSITITLPSYLGTQDLDATDRIFDEAVDFVDPDDCGNSITHHVSLPNQRYYHIEHIVDGNIIRQFMQNAAEGRLRSGATATTGPVALSFFRAARTMPLLPNPPPLPGGANYVRLYDRVMETLGDEFNRATFVLAHEDINAVKGFLVQGQNPIARSKWEEKVSNLNDPDYVLTRIRASIAMIHYLNSRGTPNINQHLTTIVNNVAAQWKHGQLSYNEDHEEEVQVHEFWKEWIIDFFSTFLVAHAKEFCEDLIDRMEEVWGAVNFDTDDEAAAVIEQLHELKNNLDSLTINTSGFNQ
ncbi:glycoside hydrolase family 18 protein [Sporormia fimetaria CBS 119925]|uniref:chitinase n=1 Tax=Sporormia fimetaria CBS 119925 TaxID=1340428 RepID=A0A6A6V166_9PLEO|nr:glycoside hydrolase family 18 protein [Sporormia fimetaria CBS 119925]